MWAIALSPAFEEDATVFAGAFLTGGLFRSTDGGETWHSGGLVGHDISAIAFSPSYRRDETLFAGADGGGVFRSTDGGNSWQAVNQGLTDWRVQALAVSPGFSADSTLFAATVDGGVFRSTSDGNSWQPVNQGIQETNTTFIRDIAISPNFSSDATVFVAASGAQGIFRSTDAGKSWEPLDQGLPIGDARAVAVSPSFAGDGTVYVGDSGSGVYRSINRGETWRRVSEGLVNTRVRALTLSPDYARDATLLAGTDGGGVYRSTDGGGSWEQANRGLPYPPRVFALAVPPPASGRQASILAGTVDGLYRYIAPRPAPSPPSTPGPLPQLRVEKAFPDLPATPRMVQLTHAGDASRRLFVATQRGKIVVFDNRPDVSDFEVFLDLSDRVHVFFEQGLFSLAFDPGFEENGYFYVAYTEKGTEDSVISRFSVSRGDPNRADPQSELEILRIPQPAIAHHGGTLAFGPDGFLYYSQGEVGQYRAPQQKTSLYGSILRMDVSHVTAEERYRIPADNPFVGAGDGVREEIWAYGFRNPWKISFDRVTGDLWTADAGRDRFEEVDVVHKGHNYGWPEMEGPLNGPDCDDNCDRPEFIGPAGGYPHQKGCAVAGGHVYRGDRLPSLQGAYVYGDFCTGRIWGLRHDGEQTTQEALLADAPFGIASFGEDEGGELYVLGFTYEPSGSDGGGIYRLVE